MRGGPRRLYSAVPLSGHPRRVCATATRRRDAIAHTTTDERHRPPLSAGDLLLSFAFHGPRPAGWWLGWLEMLVAPVKSQLNVTALSQLGSGKCF